jgi:hypothetical protein
MSSLLKIFSSSSDFGATFFHNKMCALIMAKIGWAAFWAIFSQTHPVALFPVQ